MYILCVIKFKMSDLVYTYGITRISHRDTITH